CLPVSGGFIAKESFTGSQPSLFFCASSAFSFVAGCLVVVSPLFSELVIRCLQPIPIRIPYKDREKNGFAYLWCY
ncbi:MAG: hypothetical protein M0O96_05390, partial [Desulforhopalus sp.]|nr:hypothetical protein [Desulforhopalus sp.]